MDQVKKVKAKKPFYKKWWVWLIAIVVIGALANPSVEENVSEANETKVIEVSGAKAEVSSEKKTEEKPKVEKPVKEKPKAEENPKVETVVISALDLYNAYDSNEVSADQKYRDKQLEVTGKVKDIGKDIFDKIYVTLDVGAGIGSVYISFEKGQDDAIAALSKGQNLTVVGKGGGFTALSVTLKNSQIK